MTQIIFSIFYLLGSLISYWMLFVDHASEGKPYTHGAQLLNIIFSLLSWLMVLITLITTWAKKIAITGYWAKPVTPENIKPESK